jgi:hypothetical protein
MTDEFVTELSLRITISPNSHTTQGLREKWLWIFRTAVRKSGDDIRNTGKMEVRRRVCPAGD